MRILIVADKLIGGAGNVAQQLATCFSQKEENTVFLLIDASDKPKYDLSKVNIIDRRITPVKLKNPIKLIIRFVKNTKKLKNTINSCKADVIISFLNTISPEILFSQWRSKTPVIVSERSNPYVEWEKKDRLNKLKWWLSYRRANLIVYQFKTFEPFFSYAYKRKKTRVIPNMIFSDAGRSSLQKVSVHNPIKFATVATLYPVKRIGLMISIFESLLKKQQNIELNIYGDGPDRKTLEQQVRDLCLENHVFFHGHVLDTIERLSNNDVMLLTSEREGFPNAILDAMEAGVPSVMFKCHDGLSEIIIDGENGFLIKQNDVQAYTDKLEYLVKHPHIIVEMSKNASVMKQQYDKEAVIMLWEKYVKSII